MIDFDDFSKLKEEYNESIIQLNNQLKIISQKIATCDLSDNLWPDKNLIIFQSYKDLDIKGKREIIGLFTPAPINISTSKFDRFTINEVLSLIVQSRG